MIVVSKPLLKVLSLAYKTVLWTASGVLWFTWVYVVHALHQQPHPTKNGE